MSRRYLTMIKKRKITKTDAIKKAKRYGLEYEVELFIDNFKKDHRNDYLVLGKTEAELENDACLDALMEWDIL